MISAGGPESRELGVSFGEAESGEVDVSFGGAESREVGVPFGGAESREVGVPLGGAESREVGVSLGGAESRVVILVASEGAGTLEGASEGLLLGLEVNVVGRLDMEGEEVGDSVVGNGVGLPLGTIDTLG